MTTIQPRNAYDALPGTPNVDDSFISVPDSPEKSISTAERDAVDAAAALAAAAAAAAIAALKHRPYAKPWSERPTSTPFHKSHGPGRPGRPCLISRGVPDMKGEPGQEVLCYTDRPWSERHTASAGGGMKTTSGRGAIHWAGFKTAPAGNLTKGQLHAPWADDMYSLGPIDAKNARNTDEWLLPKTPLCSEKRPFVYDLDNNLPYDSRAKMQHDPQKYSSAFADSAPRFPTKTPQETTAETNLWGTIGERAASVKSTSFAFGSNVPKKLEVARLNSEAGYLFFGNDDDNATLTDDLMYPGTVNLKDQGAHWIRKSGTVPQISAIPRFAPVVGTVRDCDVDERGPPLSLRVTTTSKSREMVITTPRALWDGKVPTAYDNRFLPRKHLTETMLTKVTEPAKATRKVRGKARDRWERGRVKTYREKDGFLLPADRTHRRNMRRRKEQKKKQTEERRRKRQEERTRRELERQRLRQKRREEDATTSEEEEDDDDGDGAAGGGDSLDDTDEDEEREGGDDDESGMMMGEVDARNRRTAPPPPAAAAAVNMRASTAAPRARKATPSGGSHDNGFRPRRAASRGAILGPTASLRPLVSREEARYRRELVGMQVILRLMDGLFIQLRVQPYDTIEEVKMMLMLKKGLPRRVQAKLSMPMGQMFVHEGRVLEDWTTLAQNRIGNMHTIRVVFALTRRLPGSNPYQHADRR